MRTSTGEKRETWEDPSDAYKLTYMLFRKNTVKLSSWDAGRVTMLETLQ